MDGAPDSGDDSAAMSVEQLGRVFARVEESAARAVSDPDATGSAVELLRKALARARENEPDVETTCALPDASVRFVFMTVCERCGIDVYRRPRQRKTSATICAPHSFVDAVLWPMVTEMTRQLDSWFVDQVLAILRTWETHSPFEDSSASR